MKQQSRLRLALPLLLLGGLGLAPDQAQARLIPFAFSNDGEEQCIIIDGPWFRT
jgi:hypothetical protein